MAKTDANKGQKGIVFNIQGYSIHDGPGIRTTVFLKGCPLRCFWCQNPESQAMKPEILLNKSICTLCGRCVKVCPAGASGIAEKSSIIDRNECTGCGRCVEDCPVQARSLVGKYLTVAEVVTEVLRDRKFYETSGGGVTLSGGEPTMQPEFALNILKSCKEEGIHTALETCGCTSWQTMQKLLNYTDLVLYDIKCIDTTKHQKATGRPNNIILENAKKISICKPMRVRVPLIPGFNDSVEDIQVIAEWVKIELSSVEIDLLPYNKLGEGKNNRLDRKGVQMEPQSEDHIKSLEELIKSE